MTKRKPDLHPTTALKLHSFGLQRLHDPNWTGITLFDELKQHVRGRREPTTILFRTIENGLLFHLGLWLYREYLQDESFVEGLGGEYLAWYLEDCLNFLRHHYVPDKSDVLDGLDRELRRIDAMYDKSEDRYWDYLDSEQGEGVGRLRTHWEHIQRSFRKRIESFAPLYAGDYADRVFHDRQLCGHISRIVVLIGFDGASEDGDKPQQWVERQQIPQWAKKAVSARDRGKCALCCTDLINELREDNQIDHIVPLWAGGSNDLENPNVV